MIRNIIWDLDGTIFNTWPASAKAYQNAIKFLGKAASINWIKNELIKIPYRYRFSTLAEKYGLNAGAIEQDFITYYSSIPAKDCPPFFGVEKILRYICSIHGKNVIVTNREREGAMRLLSTHKMSDYFVAVVSNDDGYPSKPDTTAFEVVLENLNLNREEIICVGDQDTDIITGQSVGIFSCLYGNESINVKPDLVFKNYAALYFHILGRTDHTLDIELNK